MKAFTLVALGFVATGAPSFAARQVSGDADDALREAWSRLTSDERAEFAEWFRYECTQLKTVRARTIAFVVASNAEETGRWSEVSTTPHYDPALHAPALPIERSVVDRSSPRFVDAYAAIMPDEHPRAPRPGWIYDWGSGEIRRAPGFDDPERVFTNALNGYPPELDLARAITLRTLDQGEVRDELAAFSHTYTDREGGVYPGITLYDAWRAGHVIEMPDVDALGIIHDVLDDWDRWISPVRASEHAGLYARIGELYLPARRYRELREALADVLFLDECPVPGEFTTAHTSLHALWVEASADPAELAPDLPDADDTRRFVADTLRRRGSDPTLYRAASARHKQLAKDERTFRRVLVGVLRKMGAFDKESR